MSKKQSWDLGKIIDLAKAFSTTLPKNMEVEALVEFANNLPPQIKDSLKAKLLIKQINEKEIEERKIVEEISSMSSLARDSFLAHHHTED